jgi:hypothetical protein
MRNSKIIDLPNLSTTNIDTISEGEKDKYVNDFKLLFHYQNSFKISKDSWRKLLKGEGDAGVSWIQSNEKVIGFVFCLFYNQDHKILDFRIRTIIEKQFWIVPFFNFLVRIPKWLNLNLTFVEQNNIAYTNLFQGGGGSENLVFCDDTAGEFMLINRMVEDFKRNAKGIFNIPDGHNFTQQGEIFRSDCDFMNNLGTSAKDYFTVSLGWDKAITETFNFIISINPNGLINGIKCPAPETGCTYS